MATSEARIKANRENAKRSTGPKTPEGKARSRRNGLKHGLAGEGIVLHPEDEAILAERLDAWTREVQPEGEMQEYFLARAVRASVRMDRCEKLELKIIAEKTKEARRVVEMPEAERVEALGARLIDGDMEARRTLMGSAAGCAWMMGQWDHLARSFRFRDGLRGEDLKQVVMLLGPGPDGYDDHPLLARFQILNDRMRPSERERALLSRMDATSTPDPLDPAWREVEAMAERQGKAREAFQAMIDREVETLKGHRAELVREERAAALPGRCLVDLGPEGILLRRYESACESTFYRALNQLSKLQKEARKRREEGDDAAFPEVIEPAGPEDIELQGEPNADPTAVPPDRPSEAPPTPEPPPEAPAEQAEANAPAPVARPGVARPAPSPEGIAAHELHDTRLAISGWLSKDKDGPMSVG